jgi:hypothetical protein
MSICERVIAAFKECDVQGTGCVTVDVLRALLISLNNAAWSDAKLDQLLAAFGVADAKTIRYDEFFRWLYSSRKPEAVQSPQTPDAKTTAAREAPITASSSAQNETNRAGLLAPSLDPSTPLGAALSRQEPEEKANAVAELLKSQPEVASATDAHGRRPLHLALRMGQPREVVKMLLEADLQAAAVQDIYGSLPLHVALSVSSTSNETVLDILQAHAEGASVVEKSSGMLPIHLALMRSGPGFHADVIKALLEAHPSGSLAKAPSGDRPIQLAVYLDRGQAVMQELLKAAWKFQLTK